MQIVAVRYRTLEIPLKIQFKQSNNSGTAHSASLLLELDTADGHTGYGECCPRMYVTGESMHRVMHDLKLIQDDLLQLDIPSYADLLKQFEQWHKLVGIGPSITCAIELAWLDAWSRSRHTAIPKLLYFSQFYTLRYSLVLPLVRPEQMPQLLEMVKPFQPPDIKLKVDTDQARNLANVRSLRARYGADFPIRVDVNGGWSLEEARRYIPNLMEEGVTSFEQPVAPKDLSGMQQLTHEFGEVASIMADESLLTLKDATYLLQNKICNHFNLKISKLGGIRNTYAIYLLAESYKVPCQLGAHFGETSLLTAAGAILAHKVEGKLTACEGALGEFLLEQDICTPSMQHDLAGKLDLSRFWQQPGLTPPVNKQSTT